MNQPARNHWVLKSFFIVLSLAIPAVVVTQLRGEDEKKPADEKPSKLAKDLIGAWGLAGTPDNPEDAPKKGGPIKFFTGKYWCVTHPDAETGKVIHHHGGTYTLDGDEYAETIQYAGESTASLINQTMKFKIKVEGDTYTQIGVGNDYNEVWKRLK
jgi:hypothetical protein